MYTYQSVPASISIVAHSAIALAPSASAARPRTHMINGVWLSESTSFCDAPSVKKKMTRTF